MGNIFFNFEDINKKYLLYKTENNRINYAINYQIKLEKKRKELIEKLNEFDKNTKNKTIQVQ